MTVYKARFVGGLDQFGDYFTVWGQPTIFMRFREDEKTTSWHRLYKYKEEPLKQADLQGSISTANITVHRLHEECQIDVLALDDDTVVFSETVRMVEVTDPDGDTPKYVTFEAAKAAPFSWE